jgi:hypothetical protein
MRIIIKQFSWFYRGTCSTKIRLRRATTIPDTYK